MEGTLKDYQKVYRMLEDDESRDIYLNRLNWEISGDPKYLAAIITNYVHTDSFLFPGGEPIENFRNALPKDKKIVLYGAGKLAEDTISFWRDDDRFAGFCCKTKEKQKSGYLGYPVMSPEELLAQRELNVAVYTVKFRDEILRILRDGGYPEEQIFDVNRYLPWDGLDGQYFGPEFMKFDDGEVFVDGGCLDLETSLQLKRYCRRIKKVYAFEPDEENYRRCVARKAETGFQEAEILPYATWSSRTTLQFKATSNGSSTIDESGSFRVPAISIDEATNDADRVTMIKLDVEGAELESLKGARETILRDKPKLAICIYHKPEDLTEIPLYIKELVPDYRFYIRHHSNLFTETVLYAVMP